MTPPAPSLVGMDMAELRNLMTEHGQPPFRAGQLSKWLYERAETDIEAMKDIPGPLRRILAKHYTVNPLHIADRRHSTDGVDKLLVHGGDGEVFECVLLPYEKRTSCCLSTQVGCPMGCTFCATGLGGFDRNLTAGEIVGQYLLLQPISETRVSHVVFMGMGEPLLNLDNLRKAMRILHDQVGLSYRHLTVSTVGLVPQILELAKDDIPIHLALSLHSPFDEIRSQLMPVNNRWPVAVVMQAMRDYQKATGRKITIEYLLIDGLNDTVEQARALANLAKGVPNVINLIPFNYVDTERGFRRPKRENVRAFRKELENRGMNVTERVERGHDIAAACGQLAGQHHGRFARRGHLATLPVSG
ncbi:MAG: 23S rRNA (adenine(2503)-C(2))-methyltransferase RlmN [Fimbriimonadaceae bacterium]|nr:23S rRNA (adenine(2503)-C(2))-methyltransferase RlmN [Fimbriimonadaceae bacterium]